MEGPDALAELNQDAAAKIALGTRARLGARHPPARRRRWRYSPVAATARALDLKTWAPLARRSCAGARGVADLFELTLEQLEPRDLLPHCRRLLANQREQTGTAEPGVARRSAMAVSILSWRSGNPASVPTDEAHPLHARSCTVDSPMPPGRSR